MGRWQRYKLGKHRSDIGRVARYLVRSAYRDVAGYRRLVDAAGVSVGRFRGLDDLPQLPIIDKETLFRRLELSDVMRRGVDPGRCERVGTSGSTGLPLTVFMSPVEASYRRLLLLRAWRRLASLPFPLRVADVGGWIQGEVPVVRRRIPGVEIIRVPISLPPEQQIHHVLRHRPSLISGYPSSLSVLAEAWRDMGCRAASLRLIATRGEILHVEARQALEDAFRCRVADFYNSEEVGNMAWECPADALSLHVNTDACILEVVDDAGCAAAAGHEGRIIVTNLYNWTMPFIRYDLHDRGMLLTAEEERCPCGCSAPRLAVVQGRDDDFVILPDGRRVSPRLIATAVNRSFGGLSALGSFDRHFRAFQVVQDGLDHLTVRIIPEEGRAIDFSSLIGPMLTTIHPDLRCTVEVVHELPREASGKFKKVIRLIANEDTTRARRV